MSAELAWLLIPLASKLGWVDHPGAHKTHEHGTPPIGGLTIFLAIAVAVAAAPIAELHADPLVFPLLVCSLLLMVTGIADDLNEIRALTRFVWQITICLWMIFWGGARLDDFGELFSGNVLQLGRLAVPITIFSALGVINAFNLIDGMDGLSGAMFIIAAAGMALFAVFGGQVAMSWLLIISMAAVFGFLLLNARFPWNGKARVFLGNSGSVMLGFILAWCFIRLGNGPDRAFMPMTAVWLFAVPLLDTSTSIWRRWREGRSAFSADQNHLHHAFLRAGYSVGQTWAAIVALSLVLALFGVGFELSQLPEWVSFYTFMTLAFVYYFYMKHSWASQRFFGRHFIHHDFIVEEGYV